MSILNDEDMIFNNSKTKRPSKFKHSHVLVDESFIQLHIVFLFFHVIFGSALF